MRSRSSRKCVRVAHHISGFWKPVYTGDPLTTGSLGAGLVITPYAEACYLSSQEPLRILINGSEATHPTLMRALGLLGVEGSYDMRGRLTVVEPLPLAVGYATSAAVTLSALLALTAGLDIEGGKAAVIAHVSEVLERTGLGDVLSIYEGGGLTLRTKAGAPGIGRALALGHSSDEDHVVVSCALGTASTSEMLERLKGRLETVGGVALETFEKGPGLRRFLEVSREFSKELGFLTDELEDYIRSRGLSSLCLGYYAKKKVLVLVCRKEVVMRVIEELSPLCGPRIYTHYLAGKGVVY